MQRTLELLATQTGLFVILGLLVLIIVVVIQSPLPKSLRALIVVALVMRVVGAVARLIVLLEFYRGSGDAMGYYRMGATFAPLFQSFDWSPLLYPADFGLEERWWGTTFMHWISGFVLSVIGPTILGEFVVFSMVSFLGLACFVGAFRRAFPAAPFLRYARWVWLFPSLWFWPASVGKEAVVLLGVGLSVLGFVGRRDRIQWLPLVAGIGLVFVTRPQFAALFVVVAFMAYWLGLGRQWTAGKSIQGLLIAAASIAVAVVGLRDTGMVTFDLEGAQEYIESEGGRSAGGGSEISAPEVEPAGIAMAFVNVLFRPLPWEADSLMALASSMELFFLWAYVLVRWRRIRQTLQGWRSSRFLRLAAAFIFAYSVSLGMMAGNLGIIARQRIFIFPFLFVFFEAVVPAARSVARRPHPAIPSVRPPQRTGPGGATWPVPTNTVPGRSSSP